MPEHDNNATGLAAATTGRVAGGVLLAAAILTIFAMAHHPTGVGSGAGGGVMTLGGFIHATMLVLLTANLWGLTVFTVRQGAGGWMMAGMLVYGMSYFGNLVAGTVNGFIVPAVAAKVDRIASADLFTTLWQLNQGFATLAAYAVGAAFIFWSVFLLRRGKTADIVIGCIGLLAAIGPGLALFTGAIMLDVDGAIVVYGMHAAWTGLLGLQMIRQRL